MQIIEKSFAESKKFYNFALRNKQETTTTMKAPKFNLKKIAENGARTMKVYGMAAKTAAAIWGADYDLNDEQLSILEKAILAAYIA